MKNFYTKLILALFFSVLIPEGVYALVPNSSVLSGFVEEDRPSADCDNVTESGEIGYNQTNVGAFIPETIVSLSPASGGTGPIEYVWIKRIPGVFVWDMIPGASGEEYSPELVIETTIFRRCARNIGCDSFDGESNDITITIEAPDHLDVDEFNDCSLEGGVEYDVQIAGMEDDLDGCISVDDTADMVSMYVEVWLQNVDCPGHDLPTIVEIEVDGVSYFATGVIAEQSSPGGAIEKIYRVEVIGMSEDVCIVDADFCEIKSIALYVKRLSEEHSSSSFKTFNRELHHSHTPGGLDDCITDVLLVGESLMARDIEVSIPIHEKDDVRTVSITITVKNDAGITVATVSESFTEQNAGNEASLYDIIIPAVPGDGTHVEIEVCSPDGIGDSFGIGAVALTTAGGCVTCEMLELTFTSENPTCDVIDGGSATASLTDGTGPFLYEWSDDQTTATATGLSAGTYTVTVTDVNDCVVEGEVTVGLPPCCNVTEPGEIGSDQENCGPFDPDLIISLAPADGGVGPVEYVWIKSDTLTPPIEGEPYWTPIPGATGTTYDPGFLTESTYFVRCSRNEGCDFYPGESNIISVIVHPVPELSISAVHLDCEDGATGSATATVTIGTAPYSYEWSDGQTTATATGLSAGTYTVTVTDVNDCVVEGEVTVGLPPCCNVTEPGEIGSDQENCGPFDPDLIISLAPADGGVGPVEYVWIKSDTLTPPIEGEPYWTPIPGATGTTYDPGFLTESTYFVRCSRNEGCDFYPGESNIISVIVHPVPELSISAVHVDCEGGATGSATATVTSGTAPYSYEWSDGQTTATAAELSAGTYTVSITDANGCIVEGEVTIEGGDALIVTISSDDASCFGGDTGSATVTVEGGLAPFTYEWSDGQITATATELSTGTYTVTVTDENGCNAMDEAIISSPDEILSEIEGDGLGDGSEIDCFGGTISVTVTVTGGTAPYSYEWSDGQITATAIELSAGTYTVSITDANGCTIEDEIEITQPDAALATTISGDAIDCFGGTSSATVTVTGGTAPYSYEWSDGQITTTAIELSAGTYTVSITDANGCTIEDEIEITQPDAALATTISGDAIDCFGGTSSATVTVTGGTAPYSYEWSDGQITTTAIELSAGTYTVSITDANGCTIEDEIEITQPDAALATTISGDAIDCFGGTSSATVTVTGGTAPYSYEWSDGQITATAIELSAGTYTVSITDANGCTIEDEIEITQPDAALATTISGDAIDCFGGTSSATVTVTGGTAPYSYEWSDGQITATAIELSAGTYTVSITDANGCTIEDEIEITQPDAELSATFEVSDVSCFGGSDGTATVTAVGGTAPYEYFWFYMEIGVPTITDAPAGTYTVVITDANGCESTAEVTISEPLEALTASIESVDVDCFGDEDGSATVIANGGTAPYSYEWSDGQVTAVAIGLSAGTYTVIVTDANDCETIEEITITGPDASLSIAITPDAVGCFGGSDGSATATVTGGTAPYSYEWSNDETTAEVTELSAGTYTVTVTDASGCTATEEVVITEPDAALSATFEVTELSCFGGSDGSATVIVAGGTGPYEYFWYYMEIGVPTITDVPAGTYTVVITDANGCELITEVTIDEPEEIEAIFEVSDVSCFGGFDGTATVTASGGTAPYEYFWYYMEIGVPTITEAPAGTYTVVITDANGCESTAEVTISEPSEPISSSFITTTASCFGSVDGSATITATGGTAPYTYEWSDGQTGLTAIDLSAGTITFIITDANGCMHEGEIEISEPAAISVEFTATNVSCFGETDGSAIASASGGTAPYSYVWSDGQTTATASDLIATTYTVTVTDENGCSGTGEVTIGEPEELALEMTATDVNCFGGFDGTAGVLVSGGTAPYEYFWYYMEIEVPVITDAPAGTYTVVVTDANGCSMIGEVEIGQPDAAIEATFTAEALTCFGGDDATATITAVGGTPGYTYLWSDGQTEATAVGLEGGVYSVIVTDASGCELTVEAIEIIEPAVMETTFLITNVTCFGDNNGTVQANVTGGTAPYTYEWSDGQTTQTALDLSPGAYTVTVTDSNGCVTISAEALVEEGVILTLETTTFIGEICDGMVSVTPSGGTAPYTYDWLHGATEAALTGLCEGVYTVTVTDANGCSATTDIIVAYTFMGIGITVSPNPVSDAAKISIQTEAETEIYVDVLNAGGQEVADNLYTGKTDEKGVAVIDFSVSYLERGMYFVRVRTINGVEVETIIVQ